MERSTVATIPPFWDFQFLDVNSINPKVIKSIIEKNLSGYLECFEGIFFLVANFGDIEDTMPNPICTGRIMIKLCPINR
jgi:hypothetical protein